MTLTCTHCGEPIQPGDETNPGRAGRPTSHRDHNICFLMFRQRIDSLEEQLEEALRCDRIHTADYAAERRQRQAANARVAELEDALYSLATVLAVYGCPHCGHPLDLIIPPAHDTEATTP